MSCLNPRMKTPVKSLIANRSFSTCAHVILLPLTRPVQLVPLKFTECGRKLTHLFVACKSWRKRSIRRLRSVTACAKHVAVLSVEAMATAAALAH
jgi:hypothetical protein